MRNDDDLEDMFIPKRKNYHGYHEFMKSQKSQEGMNVFVNGIFNLKFEAGGSFGCQRVILYQYYVNMKI